MIQKRRYIQLFQQPATSLMLPFREQLCQYFRLHVYHAIQIRRLQVLALVLNSKITVMLSLQRAMAN